MSKKEVAQKYGVPKNTISTWVKNFIGLDCDVVTTCSPATGAEIVAQILKPDFENDDDEVEDNVNESMDVEAPPRPYDVQLEDAFETMQNASLYSPKYNPLHRNLKI